MNSKLIQNTVTLSLPHFPILSVSKHRRVFSKHFTNASLWLYTNEYSLLFWLVYQTSADNTFKYSTQLLKQYQTSVKFIEQQYKTERYLDVNLTKTRRCLKSLIEKGMVLQTAKKNILMINPLLTYSADVVNNKKYKEIQVLYQVSSPQNLQDFTNYFSKLVSSYLESKKPNYQYGKRTSSNISNTR